jgi:hypothetical protein
MIFKKIYGRQMITEEQANELKLKVKQKFQERLQEKLRNKNTKSITPPPRYDELYYNFVKWLDTQ